MKLENINISKMKILLTGSKGFLGSHAASSLSANPNIRLTCSVQRLFSNADWSAELDGQQVVIHCAGLTRVSKNEFADALSEFRQVNVQGTLTLCQQAAAFGVRRFIFISSIKVNGEQTPLGRPFTATDTPAPVDAYGISKSEAEEGIRRVALETGMEIVIIRPPLVYGPNVKGNFARLLNLVNKGFLLPFGRVLNKRSLVSLDNLVDLITTCINHPKAANQIFLVGDGEDLSTTELLRRIARVAGVPSRLIPVPPFILKFAARLLFKKAVAQRLLCSLQVDISKTCNLLGWSPPQSLDEGLRRCFVEKEDN